LFPTEQPFLYGFIIIKIGYPKRIAYLYAQKWILTEELQGSRNLKNRSILGVCEDFEGECNAVITR
jgi:hypothetical protein